LWDTALEQSLGVNRDNFVRQAMGELEHALAGHARRDEIFEGFHALGPEVGAEAAR
jgi:hypothetical protein